MPRFSAEELETLAATEEVRIAPVRRNGVTGRAKRIWIVVDGGEAYIRSVRGAAGAWYRAALASRSAVLHVGSAAWPVELTQTTDPDEIVRVSEALRRKYETRWKQPTAAMLRDEVLAATLRVSPAAARA